MGFIACGDCCGWCAEKEALNFMQCMDMEMKRKVTVMKERKTN